jgi:hypothetical protein
LIAQNRGGRDASLLVILEVVVGGEQGDRSRVEKARLAPLSDIEYFRALAI